MSKDRKIPMGRNANLPFREGDNHTTKVVDTLDGFFSLWRGLDYMYPRGDFMNFNVRGQFVTVYFRPHIKEFYVNELDRRGYTSFGLRDRKVEEGYPFADYYCMIGPYQVRIATYNEKI